MKRIMGSVVNNTFIRPCINCKHFVKHYPDYPDEPINNTLYGKCELFSNVDLVTGHKTYDYANEVRSSESLCGVTGKYFELKY